MKWVKTSKFEHCFCRLDIVSNISIQTASNSLSNANITHLSPATCYLGTNKENLGPNFFRTNL